MYAQFPYPGPALDERWHIYIPSPEARITALEKGDVDSIVVNRKEDYFRLLEEGFTFSRFAMTGLGAGFWFNCRPEGAPCNNTAFRRALSHLIPKGDLISTVFGPLAEEEISCISFAYGKWYNPNVQVYEYDPELAARLLDEAGYVLPPGARWRIDPATGTTLKALRWVWPSEFTWYTPFVERWTAEAEAIGIPVSLEPTDFGTWAIKCLYDRTFDITMIGFTWYPTPDVLYLFWHSSQDVPGALNLAGLNNATLDAMLDTMLTTLDENLAVECAHKAQQIIMDQAAIIPIYTAILTRAYNPQLMGFVESPAYSGYWALEALRLKWRDRWGGTVKIGVAEEPDNLNPLYSMYDAGMIICTFVTEGIQGPGMMIMDPYTFEFKPWIVKKWTQEAWSDPEIGVTNGTKTTLWLNEGIYFHDSDPGPDDKFGTADDGIVHEFTADYVKFSLEYLRDTKNPTALPVYEHLVKIIVKDRYTVEIYHNQTGLLLLNYISMWGNQVPKHIYNFNVTLYGEPAGIPEGSYEGQVGYGVRDPAIFRPWETPNPWFPDTLTCLVGTGPWIFPPGGWKAGEYVYVKANRHYFKTLIYGDINFDFKVDIKDIFVAAKAFGSELGKPRWDVKADVNGDKKVDIKDIYLVARDFGKTW